MNERPVFLVLWLGVLAGGMVLILIGASGAASSIQVWIGTLMVPVGAVFSFMVAVDILRGEDR